MVHPRLARTLVMLSTRLARTLMPRAAETTVASSSVDAGMEAILTMMPSPSVSIRETIATRPTRELQVVVDVIAGTMVGGKF